MSLIAKVRDDQIEARKNKDSLKATLLTTLLGELGRDGSNVTITDEDVVKASKKFIKGINETLEHLKNTDNVEAKQVAVQERTILEAYLPRQMTKEQIKGAILLSWKQRPFNKGQLMSWLKANYAGQYDGKDAAGAVDELIKEQA